VEASGTVVAAIGKLEALMLQTTWAADRQATTTASVRMLVGAAERAVPALVVVVVAAAVLAPQERAATGATAETHPRGLVSSVRPRQPTLGPVAVVAERLVVVQTTVTVAPEGRASSRSTTSR
jgi:hypothetical protein